MTGAHPRFLVSLAFVVGASALAACSSSSSSGTDAPGDAPADLVADVPSPDAHPDVPSADVPRDTPVVDADDVPPVDVPDVPPVDVPADTGPDIDFDAMPPLLTPEQIGFESLEPTWTGSVMYFNTWGSSGKDEIWMMRPEAPADRKIRLQASRIWAFGVDTDGTIAFSSADPLKGTNYPDLENLGDAIQYTWLVRPGQAAEQISNGRINDECHVFLPDHQTLLLCRRAHFYWDGANYLNDSYRVVRVDLATGAQAFLSPLVPFVEDNNAYPRADGRLLYSRFYDDTRTTALWSMKADGTDPREELENGYRAVVSQDGLTAWFKKSGSNATWKAPSDQLAAGAVVPIVNGQSADDLTPSPDGTQIAFTVQDSANNCADVWVAKVDGTEQTMLLDCSANANIFIAGLRWVMTPVP